MSFFKEFKAFISRGNVVDMAVGVVVGGAFKSIVDSLVADIIMPAVSLLTGDVNIADISFSVGSIDIKYGAFLQNVINFLIIAFTIFCVIKGMNAVRVRFEKQKEDDLKQEDEETTPSPSPEETLLTEIRDLLKEKQ